MQRKTYSPWRPLRDPRLLFISVILLAATAITGIFSFNSVRQSTEDAAIERLGGEARLIGQNVKTAMLNMMRDAVIVSNTPPIQGIIRSGKAGGIDPLDGSRSVRWRERLATILTSIMRLRPEYTQMRYVGFADGGREIVRVDRVGDQLKTTAMPELQQKGEEPYMKAAEKLVFGEQMFSDVTFNREHGKIEGKGLPVIRAIVPVFDDVDGGRFGVVVINAGYEALLSQALAKLRPSLKTYLVNGNGDYLVHDPQAGLGDLEFHQAYSAGVPPIVAYFREFPNREALYREDGEVGFLLPSDILENGKTRVGVAMVVPQEKLLAPARRIGTQILVLFITLLVSMVAFLWLLIRHYTAPLTEMTNTVLDAGSVDGLPVWRDDEIGALARAFVNLTESLERTEAQSRAILQTVNDGIITIDAKGTIASVNPACEDIFGYTEAECLGQNVKMLMPPRFSNAHDNYLRAYAETGKKQIIGFGREVEGLRKDGSVFALDLSVSEMTIGGQKMFTGIVRDVSLRKQAEVQIEEQKEFLDLVINTNPNFVFVLNDDMRLIEANSALRQVMKTARKKEIEEAPLVLNLREEDLKKIEVAKSQAIQDGYCEISETIHFPDGRDRNVTLQMVRFENNAGETFVLCVGRDQTELEKLTGLLKESNRELDDFAYVASHDLKAPLRVIDNASSWLQEDLSATLDEDSLENLELIRSRVARMERLLDDLLEYSRIGRKLQSGSEEIMRGDALLGDVVELLTPAPGPKVQVSAAFADIELPRMPLQQIFLNLIGNAIKHAGDEDVQVSVDAKDLGDAYCFSVHDDGPGIPKEYHDQIFQMFQTLKPRDALEGSGMGLAMVRKHVERSGGRAWVESIPGDGATFYFTWKKEPERH